MNDTPESYLIAKYVAGACNTDDLVNYANSQLDKGIYSKALVDIIDAEPKHWELVSAFFERAIGQLPSYDDSIELIIKHHLQLIAAKKADPFCQFKQLLGDIRHVDLHENITKYVADNVGIEHLYGLYYARGDLPANDSHGVAEIASQMQEASKAWLSQR